ncbi:MAG: ParB/RepB/Spo0J family partition protein [Candidatus Omnitrophica bacterium]|nr:ParB/RepB/Spo0J family partition protein [Candidatus Omnitrophota bacterium]
MEKKRALGRGLQALIPDIKPEVDLNLGADIKTEIATDATEFIVLLNTADIKPGRYQPRSAFNQDKLQELILSIKEQGVVQPVLARKRGTGYELIAGERRLRAVKSLGIEKIPAIIRDVDDANAMEIALIENIQREELNPIEEAKAYQRLAREFGFTQERIAQSVGKDRTSVTNLLRLLNLPAKIQGFILDGFLAMGHARALLSVLDARRQMKICEKIIKKGLSVREAERMVKPHSAIRKTSAYRTADPHLRNIEEDLQQVLGTRVRVQHGKKRGKVVIEYLSPADLERVIGIIKR